MPSMQVTHGRHQANPNPFPLPLPGQALHAGNRLYNSHHGKLIDQTSRGNAYCKRSMSLTNPPVVE